MSLPVQAHRLPCRAQFVPLPAVQEPRALCQACHVACRAAIWAHPAPGPRSPAALQTVVLSLTVVWDLIAAVAVGCILSSLQFTRRMAEIEIESLQITSSSDLDGGLPSREESGLREEELQLMKRFSGAPMGWGSHPVSAAQLGCAACIEPKHLVAVELQCGHHPVFTCMQLPMACYVS